MPLSRCPDPPLLPISERAAQDADDVPSLCDGIGPTEVAMAGRLFRVHFEFGDPYVLYDRVADLLLLRPL